MTTGEKIKLIGLGGMILAALCMDSEFFVPAAILFMAFGIMTFSCHFMMDEGFIDSDDMRKIDQKKIRQNREQVFNMWVLTGTVKKGKRKAPRQRGN